MLAETEQAGRPIGSPDGLIGRMVRAVLERAVETEMAGHLGINVRGMATRDIKAHLGEVSGVDVSDETVAKVTDVFVEEILSWQSPAGR